MGRGCVLLPRYSTMTANEFYSKKVRLGDTVMYRGHEVTVLNALTVSSDKQGKAMKVEIAKDVWVDVDEIEI